MDERDPNIWFPAKRYGWGWGLPVCWQGWVVMLSWMALVFAGSVLFALRPILGAAFLLLMICALIAVCWAKGEKPRWRWGKD